VGPACCGEEKKLLPLPGIDPWFIGSPAHSLVYVKTSFPSLMREPLRSSCQNLICNCAQGQFLLSDDKTKLRGFSPQVTISTERPPLVSEVSANFCVAWSAQRISTAVNLSFLDPEPLLLCKISAACVHCTCQ
jgi:hypothetical protein